MAREMTKEECINKLIHNDAILRQDLSIEHEAKLPEMIMAIKALESWDKVIEEISSMNFNVSPNGQDFVLVADVLECIKRNIYCTACFEVGDRVINKCKDSSDYGNYGKVYNIYKDTVEVMVLTRDGVAICQDKDILHWAKIYRHNY